MASVRILSHRVRCLSTQEHEQVRRKTGKQIMHQIKTGKAAVNAEHMDALRFLSLGLPPPPPSWTKLQALIATRSCAKGQKAELRKALAPRIYSVPLEPSAAACNCCITGTHFGRRFASRSLNRYLAALFEEMPSAILEAGLPPVTLSRYDLHHAHLFAALNSGTSSLGLLFHCREYPAASDPEFPVDLGYCQVNSPLEYTVDAMGWRNVVWIDGQAAAVNVGVSSPLREALLMDGLQDAFTVLETDLGDVPLCDIYYLNGVPGRKPEHRVFVLPW